jgi:hypothetical protein
MALFNGQSFLTLLVLVLLSLPNTTTARVDPKQSVRSEDVLGQYLKRAKPFGSTIQGRQNDGCTPQPNCSPSTCSETVCNVPGRKKRALKAISIGSTGNITEYTPEFDLAKRALRGVRQNAINNYLRRQGEAGHLINLCPANEGGYGTPSFCVQYRFNDRNIPVDPTTGQMLVGTGNTELTGCTVLTIASSRGVYMVRYSVIIHHLVPRSKCDVEVTCVSD